jgi:hypothetical protein
MHVSRGVLASMAIASLLIAACGAGGPSPSPSWIPVSGHDGGAYAVVGKSELLAMEETSCVNQVAVSVIYTKAGEYVGSRVVYSDGPVMENTPFNRAVPPDPDGQADAWHVDGVWCLDGQ